MRVMNERKKVCVVQLVAAEERCALAETEIREEVSTEMASLLHDMEANYKVTLCVYLHYL